MTKKPSNSDVIVQLFNESVLGSAPCDTIPNLLPNPKANWTPKQIILDYKDNACYGGMLRYDRSHSFEYLRRAFNERFHAYENPTFANDSSMGIWRLEDKGFAIQLSVNEDEDSYMAIYLRFVDPKTMADKFIDVLESSPNPFSDYPVDEFSDALCEMDASNTQQPQEGYLQSMDDVPEIEGAELVVRRFGYWPLFHDAEVLWVHVGRQKECGFQEPAVEMVVHVFEMTSEVTEDGCYRLEKHSLVHFRFEQVTELRIDGFNHQNVIFGLDVVKETTTDSRNKYRVTLSPCFGMAGEFCCVHPKVLSVLPCDADGNKLEQGR